MLTFKLYLRNVLIKKGNSGSRAARGRKRAYLEEDVPSSTDDASAPLNKKKAGSKDKPQSRKGLQADSTNEKFADSSAEELPVISTKRKRAREQSSAATIRSKNTPKVRATKKSDKGTKRGRSIKDTKEIDPKIVKGKKARGETISKRGKVSEADIDILTTNNEESSGKRLKTLLSKKASKKESRTNSVKPSNEAKNRSVKNKLAKQSKKRNKNGPSSDKEECVDIVITTKEKGSRNILYHIKHI